MTYNCNTSIIYHFRLQEEFEDNKGVIRIPKSKNNLFVCTNVHPGGFGGVRVAHLYSCVCVRVRFVFFYLFLLVCLRSGSVLCPMFSVPLNGQFLIL